MQGWGRIRGRAPTACAQQDAEFPATRQPCSPGQGLSLVSISGETYSASGIARGSAHTGIAQVSAHTGVTQGSAHAGFTCSSAHASVARGSAHMGISPGLSTIGAQHTWILLGAQHAQSSAHAGITQGNSRWLCRAAGLRASPRPPLFALRGGVGLQAVPGVWPCVHRFVWLSSPTFGCLQSPMGEDTLPDLLSPELLLCFNSCLRRGHGPLLATQPCPSLSRATRHQPAEQND